MTILGADIKQDEVCSDKKRIEYAADSFTFEPLVQAVDKVQPGKYETGPVLSLTPYREEASYIQLERTSSNGPWAIYGNTGRETTAVHAGKQAGQAVASFCHIALDRLFKDELLSQIVAAKDHIGLIQPGPANSDDSYCFCELSSTISSGVFDDAPNALATPYEGGGKVWAPTRRGVYNVATIIENNEVDAETKDALFTQKTAGKI